MQIEGILRRRNSNVRTIHIAGILAHTGEAAEFTLNAGLKR
jgi:hypothetical protein